MRIPTSADLCRITLELLDRGLQLRQEEREEEELYRKSENYFWNYGEPASAYWESFHQVMFIIQLWSMIKNKNIFRISAPAQCVLTCWMICTSLAMTSLNLLRFSVSNRSPFVKWNGMTVWSINGTIHHNSHQYLCLSLQNVDHSLYTPNQNIILD